MPVEVLMSPSAWFFFIPVIAFIFCVTSQFLIFRIIPKFGLLRAVFLGFILGLICLICLHFWAYLHQIFYHDPIWLSPVANFLFYFCLWYSFFHYVNIGEASLRLRILTEIKSRPQGLTHAELLTHYNNQLIVGVRVKRLLDSGQIVCVNGRYFKGISRFIFLSRFFSILRRIMNPRQSAP